MNSTVPFDLPDTLRNVCVVLSGPLYGGNVGAVCRAMANMGFGELVLAAPRPLDLAEVRMMACAAWDIYARRREYPTLEEVVADCGMVVGATARLGLYRAHSQSPRALAPTILATARKAKVALVFGREDWGLSNEELALCTKIIQIPAVPESSSLNLAQAAMICLYEIFIATGSFTPAGEKSPEAPSKLRERMFALWQEALLEIGFMKADKAQHMMLGLRRFLSRGPLTVDDVKILMGIARQTRWKARHPEGCEPPFSSPQ